MCLFQLYGTHGWRKQRRFQTLVMTNFLTWCAWSQAMCLALLSCCQAQRSKPARYCRLASIIYRYFVWVPLPHHSHNEVYSPWGPAMHNWHPSCSLKTTFTREVFTINDNDIRKKISIYYSKYGNSMFFCDVSLARIWVKTLATIFTPT